MAENLSASTGVSSQIYADIKSALMNYAQNSTEYSLTAHENQNRLTRQAFFDIQKSLAKKKNTDDKNSKLTIDSHKKNISAQDNQNLQEKAEINTYTLPKNTQTIISELKRNGMHRTMSAYDISREYNVSLMKARDILDEVNIDNNGFVREYNLPKNTTISYKV